MDGTPTNSERRGSERTPQSFPLHASKVYSEILSEERITGVVCNISGRGLSFLSDADYVVGDLLHLQIDLLSSVHHLKAKVMRIDLLGDSKILGVSFVDMSPDHEQALIEALLLKK